MEMSGWLHAPASLPPKERKPPHSLGAGWVQNNTDDLEKKKSLDHILNQTQPIA